MAKINPYQRECFQGGHAGIDPNCIHCARTDEEAKRMGKPAGVYGIKTERIRRALETYPGMTATWLAHHVKDKPAIVSTTLNRLRLKGLAYRKDQGWSKGYAWFSIRSGE